MPDTWKVEPLRGLIETPVPGFWGEESIGHGLRPVRVIRNGDTASHYTVAHQDLPQRWMRPPEIAKAECQVGDILLALSGDVGAVARLNETGGETVVASNFVRRIRARSGTDENWLFFLLQATLARAAARRCSGGTTLQNLSGRFFDELVAPVPPMHEQRRIAEILDTIDDAILATERLIGKLELLNRGLGHALLTNGINEHGEFRNPELHPDEFYESSLGTTPASWKVTTLARLCSRITYGFTNPMPTADNGPLMLTAADVGYGYIDLRSARHTTESAFKRSLSDKSRPQRGDLLITKDGTLGRIACLDLDRVCVNQSVAVARPRPGVSGGFITHYLMSPLGQQAMLSEAGGSTIKHLYISKLGLMHIPVPPAAEAALIVSVIEQARVRAERERVLLDKLQLLKQGLLDDLLTGRVRVPFGAVDAA